MKKKLSDLDYCYASWMLLTDLEKLSYARNQCIRDFQERTSARKSFISALLALILPLILWGYVLYSVAGNGLLGAGNNFGTLATRLIGMFTISIFLFLIVFMLLRALWARNVLTFLRKIAERKYKAQLWTEVKEIDKKVRHIVNDSEFEDSGIPEEFLSTEILPLLIRYFESGQAVTMREALYSLKLEFQNTDYYANRLLNETLLQKEKAYLSDEKRNLEKKIEEAET